METKTMMNNNSRPDFSFWSNLTKKPFKEEEEEEVNLVEKAMEEDQIRYGEFIRQGVKKDMSYKKAIKKHEKEQQKQRECMITKPQHYHQFTIEPSDFIMKNRFSFWKGNIVKYASRAGEKIYDGMDITQSEITDLRKAIRYAEMRINQLEGKEPNAVS
jgi:hypothetical protein